MGFLSAYENTTRVPIGDPERGYWVELREVLSQGARQKAEQELMGRQQINGNDVLMKMNVVGYRQAMLLASIKGWNLDDDNGHVWPINTQSISRLPGPVFDELWAKVDASNAPRSAEAQRRFPDTGDDERADGEDEPGQYGEVLASATGVEAPGADPGAVPGAPMA
jgi:hypothetical protein